MPLTLDQRLDQLSALVEAWMRPYVEPPDPLVSGLYEMIGYHLGWRSTDGRLLQRAVGAGKRLRPILAILVCEAHGGRAEDVRGPAVAVELVHNFSLVHDDIQDQSELRRGRETVWRRWGAAQGINVGDAIFAIAQIALADQLGGHPALAAVIRRLNETCLRLVEGQFLDLNLEAATDVSLDRYEAMIARKTAALIECACALGAIVAGAGEQQVALSARAGRLLGLAFQEQDDLLGVWGDPTITGKPTGADVRSRKKGLPLVLALETATEESRRRLDDLLSGTGPLDDDQVAQTLALLQELDVRRRAEAIVADRFDAVVTAFRAAVPDGRSTELAALCDRLRVRVQ